jgi:uncharacterized membrane protein
MIDHLLPVATILAVLGSGLIAGSFFAFAAYLLPALSRLPAPNGIAAMQAVIAAIKGPLFLAVFFGTAALAGLLGLAAPLKWGEPGAFSLLIGSLLYLNLPFGVTLMKNLPLNTRLSAMKPDSAEGKRFWEEFRATWGLWNHVRWIGALGAAAAFTLALIEGSAPVPARE